MRRLLATAVLVVSVSCGGTSPTLPSGGGSPSTASFATGSYLLMVTMVTSPTGGDDRCFSSGPALPVAAIVPTPVQAEKSGDTVTIRPDDTTATFRMQLRTAGASLSGTVAGQYRSGATTVIVSPPLSLSGEPATATGAVGPSSISGALNATVAVEGLLCSSASHRWTLTAR